MLDCVIAKKTNSEVCGSPMLDLRRLTEEFIENRLELFKKDTAPDEATVKAVAAGEMEPIEREEQVRKWLAYYKVIRFFPLEKSREIAKRIIEFADEPRPNSLEMNRALIVSEFHRLTSCIQPVIPISLRSGKPPVITSLASKALWCCYPQDIPIYDGNALRALQVIGRLCRIGPETREENYDSYAYVWLQVYEKVRPVIDAADLRGYPYKVRVLDGVLWYLGEPHFETVPRS